MMELRDFRLILTGSVLRSNVGKLYPEFRRLRSRRIDQIDLSSVDRVDNAGVAFLELVRDSQDPSPEYVGATRSVQHSLELFGDIPTPKYAAEKREGCLERLGRRLYEIIHAAGSYLSLSGDVVFWTVAAPFDRRARRKGSIAEQCDRIGVQAVPIVVFLSLIIGVIVVLQSAAQLRMFGATLYVVDLLSISITRETGPLFTAIIVAGRSGSAIAAQLATMRVTEELDALTVMALDPVRYVLVPMMAGMLLTIPVLTGLSMLVGIGGGLLVAAFSLDLSVRTFLNRMVEIIGAMDLFIGIAKSYFFGGSIVLTASFFGMTSTGGSEGVGRSTTASVVVSIFAVIILNAIFSLLYLV